MVGRIDKTPQLNIFQVPLINFIEKGHELCLLAAKIDWDEIEKNLSQYYCEDNGRTSIPIRKVVSLILLRRIFDLSDEQVVSRWKENPYWQYFSGETFFQHQDPFDPTELIKFRKRIGESGAESLLKISINLFEKKEMQEKEVLIDTTVQEKNITFPTDTKLQKKIIEKVRDIADKEDIQLRQSYRRTLKQLMIDQRFREHPRRKKKARAAARKIHTIAGRMVRDIERKMTTKQREQYHDKLLLFNMVLEQKREGQNKIYSLHESEVKCIAKGKEAKKYEFGNKTSIVKTSNSGIIVGAMAFSENLYDGDTLEPQLEQVKRLVGELPKFGITDRGYRGRKSVLGTKIVTPKPLPSSTNSYQKQKARKRFRKRAGIEPIIGHLKQDHRMGRNYLSGVHGDKINTIMAATGFNLKKMLRRLKSEAALYFIDLLSVVFNISRIQIA